MQGGANISMNNIQPFKLKTTNLQVQGLVAEVQCLVVQE
jgi:hypothetical protein